MATEIAARITRRIRQLPVLTERTLRHPAWMFENVRMIGYRRADRRRGFDLASYSAIVMDAERAVCEALGVDASAYAAAKAHFRAPDAEAGPEGSSWDASNGLQSLLNVCIRLLAPDRMVETGVARGYSTAVALMTMHDLARGQLFSVELPRVLGDGQAAVGSVVPDALKSRWTLKLGPSRTTLPLILREASPIDIFLHDSDHTYASQTFEYRTAWPHIRSGGLLLSDDVANPALMDFAREVGVQPRLIGEVAHGAAIGMLVKP